ncbi:hypothetical protein SLEP1_g50915 [Rubroshorea leprosula]|uniref:Uncharacterized protein n=1 Tax=Rubroshorea leprosula TaxID=152421 RepID=A0AAV5M1S5_9ROSI|nr:hypothetical protein SLEP1_g50915 [Rubroshorea leprosula]
MFDNAFQFQKAIEGVNSAGDKWEAQQTWKTEMVVAKYTGKISGPKERNETKHIGGPNMQEGSPSYAASSNMGLAQKTIEETNPNPKNVAETEDRSNNGKKRCKNREHKIERKENSETEKENIKDNELAEESKESKEQDLPREAHRKNKKEAQIWRKRRSKKSIKMRKKKISLCSLVYSKSKDVGEGLQKIKGKRSTNNQHGGGKVDSEFVASPNGEIAGESIVNSGIQNCNRAWRKKMSDQLAKEIWDLAKHLGATTENDEDIMQGIEGMECRDRQTKTELGRQGVGDEKKVRRSQVFRKKEVLVGRSYIGVSGLWGEDQTLVYILNVCSPCQLMGKRALWKELLNLIMSRKGNWCLRGDFNDVRCVEERAGCREISREMKEFNFFIHDVGLVDLPLVGRKYT